MPGHQTDTQLKINLGCGQDVRVGWLNVDSRPLHPESDEFRCCQLTELDTLIEDESAGEILANEFLQRVAWRELDSVLVSLWKKLCTGGVLCIEVPDLDQIVADYQTGKLSHVALERKLFGTQGHADDANHSAWSEAELTKRMQMVGLTVERVERKGYKLRAWARRTDKGAHTS